MITASVMKGLKEKKDKKSINIIVIKQTNKLKWDINNRL